VAKTTSFFMRTCEKKTIEDEQTYDDDDDDDDDADDDDDDDDDDDVVSKMEKSFFNRSFADSMLEFTCQSSYLLVANSGAECLH